MTSGGKAPTLHDSLVTSDFEVRSLVAVPRIAVDPVTSVEFDMYPRDRDDGGTGTASVNVSTEADGNYEGLSGYRTEVGCVDGGRVGEVAADSSGVSLLRGGLPRGPMSRSFISSTAYFASHVGLSPFYASWGLGKACSPLHPRMVLFESSTKTVMADSQEKVCSVFPLLSNSIYVGISYGVSFAIFSLPTALVKECY